MGYSINHATIEEWCATYDGPPFHALITDAPYHLTTITKRFGKEGSAPAQFGRDGAFSRASRGFLGMTWDGGDVAFRPETWHALGQHMHPGAFGVTFGGSRTYHRIAVAIEDAGFVIHPTIAMWVYATGFPKATRIEKQIEDKEIAQVWTGHRYGLQALMPAAEPAIVFQKPYQHGVRPVDDMLATGAGALNIDGARIEGEPWTWGTQTDIRGGAYDSARPGDGDVLARDVSGGENGRWPKNFIMSHHPGCTFRGYEDGESYSINRFDSGAKPFGGAVGEDYQTERRKTARQIWECHADCAVRRFGEGTQDAARFFFNANFNCELIEQAAEIMFTAKPGTAEKEDGLRGIIPCYKGNDPEFVHYGNALTSDYHYRVGEDGVPDRTRPLPCRRNEHPTLKPISLMRYLATLLLPPDAYAPRRILVPFAGTGSEAIGAMQAGWDEIVTIEQSEAYCAIQRARMDFWAKAGIQLSLL